MRLLMITAAVGALAACSTNEPGNDSAAAANVLLADNGAVANLGNAATAPAAGGATAALRTAVGADVGTVTASQTGEGVLFTVDARAMPAGRKGIHIHAVGKCEGPKFESAGGHWNPTGSQHGKDNPAGPHLGDLPNLDISGGGTGTVTFTVPGTTIRGGANSLLDGDGAAFIVHANPDDYRTDPSGNSGDRIACGTFTG